MRYVFRWGGITIKRISMLLAVFVLLLALAACGAEKKPGLDLPDEGNTGSKTNIDQNGSVNGEADISKKPGSVTDETNLPDNDGNDANTGDDTEGKPEAAGDRELLQSASIDLDADGANEQVKAVKISYPASDAGASGRLEGRLEISDGDVVKEIVFWKKDDDLSGIMSSLQFEDMDGDGAKDVFIIIPGYGASFTYSNCYVYSYAKDKSCIFTSDNELADFIGGFRFAYENGGNRLSLINDQYGFSTELVIEDNDFTAATEDMMYEYADRTWIDPTSVDISETSRLALAKIGGSSEIKVPLPVFGMATVNMIGEIDLYYRIDENFYPVLKRCEIIDFAVDKKVKAGSFEVRK